MKHTLLIMRHAKSDRDSGADRDFDRPLNPRGIKDAARMGRWLRNQKISPDCIVSSPAVRARETILSVCNELDVDESRIVWDKRIYEAGLDDLLEVIGAHAGKVKCMLLTGHNPGLDALVNYLAHDDPKRNGDGNLMPTAAIAVLDYGSGLIAAKRGSAKLIRIVRPKEL